MGTRVIGRAAAVATLLLLALLGTSARAGSPEEDMKRARAALREHPPRFLPEYRAWVEELRSFGPAGEPALRALVREYVSGLGWDDPEAHRFLGDLPFVGRLPEWISFREHPFLRTVEAAEEKAWFRPEERSAWEAAAAAWRETVAHARRLEEDRAYRVADQVFANLASDPALAERSLRFRSAPPYALAYVGEDPPADQDAERAVEEVLEAKARVLQQVYREFLRRYGERFDLRDLGDAWGGGPDLQPYRSFPDGVPLLVVVYETPELLSEVLTEGTRADYFRDGEPVGAALYGFHPRTGAVRLHARPPDLPAGIDVSVSETDAVAATRQLLHWFTRQRNRWRAPPFQDEACSWGFAWWFASLRRDGTLAPGETDGGRGDALRDLMRRFREVRREYPVFPLARLGAMTPTEAARYAQEAWGLGTGVALRIYQLESWALFAFLDRADGGSRRAAIDEVIGAMLGWETGGGQTGRVFAKALGVRDEEDWAPHEAAWLRFLTEELGGDRPAGDGEGAAPPR